MLSQVAICNRALQKIGAAAIIDITDTAKSAQECNRAFEPIRDALLRSHRWAFAMTRTSLAALSTVPAFGFNLQYQLPADLLRLDYFGDLFVGLDPSNYRNQSNAEFQIEGRLLLTDAHAPLHIRYVKRITDSTQFDPLFDEALAAKIAEQICEAVTQSDTKKQWCAQDFKATVAGAVRVNAIEKAPEPIPDDTWMTSRL